MIIEIFFGLLMLGMVYVGWKQIPAEDPEIVEARKRYGKAE